MSLPVVMTRPPARSRGYAPAGQAGMVDVHLSNIPQFRRAPASADDDPRLRAAAARHPAADSASAVSGQRSRAMAMRTVVLVAVAAADNGDARRQRQPVDRAAGETGEAPSHSASSATRDVEDEQVPVQHQVDDARHGCPREIPRLLGRDPADVDGDERGRPGRARPRPVSPSRHRSRPRRPARASDRLQAATVGGLEQRDEVVDGRRPRADVRASRPRRAATAGPDGELRVEGRDLSGH